MSNTASEQRTSGYKKVDHIKGAANWNLPTPNSRGYRYKMVQGNRHGFGHKDDPLTDVVFETWRAWIVANKKVPIVSEVRDLVEQCREQGIEIPENHPFTVKKPKSSEPRPKVDHDKTDSDAIRIDQPEASQPVAITDAYSQPSGIEVVVSSAHQVPQVTARQDVGVPQNHPTNTATPPPARPVLAPAVWTAAAVIACIGSSLITAMLKSPHVITKEVPVVTEVSAIDGIRLTEDQVAAVEALLNNSDFRKSGDLSSFIGAPRVDGVLMTEQEIQHITTKREYERLREKARAERIMNAKDPAVEEATTDSGEPRNGTVSAIVQGSDT